MVRYVIGSLAPVSPKGGRKHWNAILRERGIDGFFDGYPAATREDLQFRLSEMFLLDRRGYILHESLQTMVLDLLDVIDASAQSAGAADTVVNEGGILHGYMCHNDDEKRCVLWFPVSIVDPHDRQS
jgi:shikimate 5-dehydrogenase